MKRELKQQWINALRSGNYQQGRCYLKADGKYCCIGVLAELADPENLKLYREEDQMYVYKEFTAFPPTEFFEEVGLSYSLGSDLASDNDTDKSFAEIADKIEELVDVDN